MTKWWTATTHHNFQDESGKILKISELRIIDGVSFTETEARVTNLLSKSHPGFQLKKLSELKVTEVFFEENGSETWYKSKVMFISFDERSQKEKRVPHTFFVNANDIIEANKLLKKYLGNLNDYKITEIILTKVIEVIAYN